MTPFSVRASSSGSRLPCPSLTGQLGALERQTSQRTAGQRGYFLPDCPSQRD